MFHARWLLDSVINPAPSYSSLVLCWGECFAKRLGSRVRNVPIPSPSQPRLNTLSWPWG